MKNLFSTPLLAFCLLLSAFCFLPHCTAQPYTVYNCGFENWTAGIPDGWGNPTYSFKVTPYTPAYSGSYSCRIQINKNPGNQPGGLFTAFEKFPIYWGKKYVLSFTAKLLGVNSLKMPVRIATTSPNYISETFARQNMI